MTMATDRREAMRRLAHELQAPITSLELRLLELERELPESTIAKSCLREIASLKELVTSFLELDPPELETSSIGLAPILARVEERFRPIANARGVSLVIDGADVRARCAPRAIERILSNLIDNAIKFSRHRGRVELTTRTGDGVLVIEVRDDGIGMSPEQLSRAFEPFYRVDRDAPGAGLGLTLCKHLSEAQRSTLRCESEIGRGTTFELTLPAT